MTEEIPPRLDTLAVTSGRSANGMSLAPPLWATSTFAQGSLDEATRMATTARPSAFYTRYGNPTTAAFEEAVATLEGAEGALAFASGMGAVSTVVLGICSAGSHVITTTSLYSATALLFSAVCPRFGIEVTVVPDGDADALAAAVVPGRTVMVYVETPTNPLLRLVDLEAVGALTPITVVDSTFAGPMLQRPLSFGVDLVVHSATKGLSGHNDATLGVVAGSNDLLSWVWSYSTIHGATASPFEALNGLRGIRTLPVRVRQQCATALRLAEFLEDHPAVVAVHHPGLDSHPQRELAKRQLDLGGTMLSFEVAGGLEAARRAVEGCRLARLAPSLGGPDTLVTHPASTTAVGLTSDERAAMGIADGLIRVSVGLEHTDDVVADLAAALTAPPA